MFVQQYKGIVVCYDTEGRVIAEGPPELFAAAPDMLAALYQIAQIQPDKCAAAGTEMTKAWHFVGDTLRDGSPIPKDGEWLTYDGKLRMCDSGLHASIEPFDALRYAPGPNLCLVHCDGEIIQGDDKLVCARRLIVARMDATDMLRYFARMQALSVVHLWDKEPPEVVLDFLMTGDESIRAAAWADASAAAWADARAAASAAARAAARADARAAARAAALSAAWAGARADARNEFNQLVYECFEDFL